MRSKRLELLEAQQKQKKPSTTKRREAPQNKRLSTAKSRSGSVNNGGKAKEAVTDAVDEGLDGGRANEIGTDAVDERPPSTAALEKLRSSTTKASAAIDNSIWANEIMNIAVDARINAVALKKRKSSTKKFNVRRAKEIVADTVEKTLDAVSLDKQMPPATKSSSAFVNDRRAKEVVTDAVDEGLNHGSAKEIGTDAVDERLDTVAIERSSATKSHNTFVNVSRENEITTDAVNERVNVVAPEEQRSAATKPFSASVIGRRAKEIGTDAVVGERLNAVALEKQRSLTIKPRITFVIRRREKEIVTDTVDARLNPDALEKQMSSTTRPFSAFADRIKASEIVTDPEDERLNAVADMLDARSDTGDEDTDTLGTRSDIRDEDADMLDTGGDTRDEDVDIHDADGNGEMQFAGDQPLPFNSDEDADILDVDENGDMQILDDESLPTNPEQVAGSSRKRNRETVQRQVTDPHSESYNANCTDNGQGRISMPSDRRIPITFDKYGRPCDVGSVGFATDIGKIVRACCRPAIESWKKVPNSVKDNIWKNVIHMYAVPEIYKPNVLSRAGTLWRNWKHNLRLELDDQKPIAERKKKIHGV